MNTCFQPSFNRYLKSIYRQLFVEIVNQEWPVQKHSFNTRMTTVHEGKVLDTQLLSGGQKAVCIDIARAGMLPSQVFFDELNQLVAPKSVRQDHVYASRVVDEKGAVTHTSLFDSKIGGDVDNSILLIPDPMGATGNSLCEVVSHYKEKVEGTPKNIIAAHMIITPEYVKKVTETHPDVIIYSVRLDRGFSTPKALAEVPGSLWDQEKGLDDNQYIVPGAGGVGELINNSFV